MVSFWPRVNTLLLLVVLVAVAGLFATRAFGGPLDPPGAPASSPGGIDGRIPIDHLPFAINESGSYVLTKNLTYATGTGITVSADHVSIDLNGFTLDGVGKSGNGIYAGGRSNPTVTNGVLRRWFYAIYNEDGGAEGGYFHGLQLAENDTGIALGRGGRLDASIVRSGTAGVSSFTGGANTITNSTFLDNTTAIFLQSSTNLIESNHIGIPAGGTGVYAGNFTTIRRNYFDHPALVGYVTIDLNTTGYAVAIENRMKASLTAGGSGAGNYIPYDTANALTNLSP